MVPPRKCTVIQNVKVSGDEYIPYLIQYTFIYCIEENTPLSWGVKVGILNTTRQNFEVVKCCDEELDMYAIPADNDGVSHG